MGRYMGNREDVGSYDRFIVIMTNLPLSHDKIVVNLLVTYPMVSDWMVFGF